MGLNWVQFRNWVFQGWSGSDLNWTVSSMKPQVKKFLQRLKNQVNHTKDSLELHWPQWTTFNLDKLLHVQTALEKMGSQPSNHYIGWGSISFSFLQFPIISMRPAWMPHSLWSLQMGSWENWQKQAKGENSYQSQFSGLYLWSREEGKFLCCPFLSECREVGKSNFCNN